MNKIENKNAFQNLDDIQAIEELSDKAAASCKGGEYSSYIPSVSSVSIPPTPSLSSLFSSKSATSFSNRTVVH